MRFYYHNCILFSLIVRYNHRRNPTTPVLVADSWLYSDVEHMQRIHKDMSYKSSRNPELERYDCGGTCDVKE